MRFTDEISGVTHTTEKLPAHAVTEEDLYEFMRRTLREMTRGHSEWTCRRGHRQKTTLYVENRHRKLVYLPDWETCNICGVNSSEAQTTKMFLDVLAQWLKQDKISTDDYRAFTDQFLAYEPLPDGREPRKVSIAKGQPSATKLTTAIPHNWEIADDLPARPRQRFFR